MSVWRLLLLLHLPACVIIIQNEKGEDTDASPADTDLPDTDLPDTDANGTIDADDDGVPAAEDCDDADPALAAIAEDGDCDGARTADDCDDQDDGLAAVSVDPDCNGIAGCQAEVDLVHPGDGATGVFYRRSGVRVEFDQDERVTGTISVRASGGAPAPGTTTFSADGETMTYTFTAPLTPSTEYIVDIGYACGSSLRSTFTTSSTGAPVNGADQVGSVYELDLLQLDPDDVHEPADWDTVEAVLIANPFPPLYLSPAAFGPGGFTTRLGVEVPGVLSPEQDLCEPAIDLPFLSSYDENPYFTGSSTNLTLPQMSGIVWNLRSVEASGAFAPDGSAIEGLQIDALIDLSGNDHLGLGDLCQLIAIAGVTCGDCGDGTSTCVRFAAEGIRAPRVDLGTLQLVDAADIAANPACEPEP
jgi:hypothetical protein